MAMLQVTNEYVELMDKEMVIVTDDQVVIKNLDGDVISRASYIAELDASDIEKGTYPHYMLKETDEQPVVMRKIIQTYQDENGKLSVPGDIAAAVAEADASISLAAEQATMQDLSVNNILKCGQTCRLKCM